MKVGEYDERLGAWVTGEEEAKGTETNQLLIGFVAAVQPFAACNFSKENQTKQNKSF